MMDLAMNFDTDECLVTAMFDKGNSEGKQGIAGVARIL